MASLTDLPTEILYMILSLLKSIDDIQSIACCSKWLRLAVETRRLNLYRSLILRSDAHQFDVRLCHLIEANTLSFALSSSVYLNPRPDYTVLMQCLDASTLTDQQVCDIAARWSGLKYYAKLYQSPVVQQMFLNTPLWTQHAVVKAEPTVDLSEILEIQSKSDGMVGKFQKQLDYGRFYAALTGSWLALEGAKSVQSVECDLLSRSNALVDRVRNLWTYRKDLETILEGVEIYDFVYAFLVPRLPCFGMENFKNWVPPDVWAWNDTDEVNWHIFIAFLPMHLSPADILDLMRDPRFASSPRQKQEYLLSLGYGDLRPQQTVQRRDANGEADQSFSLGDLEHGCVSELGKRVKGKDSLGVAETRWTEIRTKSWRPSVRCNFGDLENKCLELFWKPD